MKSCWYIAKASSRGLLRGGRNGFPSFSIISKPFEEWRSTIQVDRADSPGQNNVTGLLSTSDSGPFCSYVNVIVTNLVVILMSST